MRTAWGAFRRVGLIAERVPGLTTLMGRNLIMSRGIISDSEALQILKNDVRRLAMERHAAGLKDDSPERRVGILAQIERDIRQELRKRSVRIDPGTLLC